ncbi:MAG: hypothetical protein U0V87_16595 [Acidobacteriota bacterium]
MRFDSAQSSGRTSFAVGQVETRQAPLKRASRHPRRTASGDGFDQHTPHEVHSEGAPATAFVVVEPFTPTGNDLKAVVGRYYSDEADNTYEMVLESDQLFVRDKQGNQTPLAPAFKDAFSTAGFGTLQFARNADGRVDRFSVSLGRSRGLVFTRVEELAR